MSKSIFLAGFVALWALWGVHPAVAFMPVIGEKAPEFMGVDSKGERVSLADFKGKPLILEWTNHQCPYVKKHYESGNMQRLQRQLTEAGAEWVSIISSAPGKQGYVDAATAEKLAVSRGAYADRVLLDPEGTIGRLYGAKTTPQLFLIDEQSVVRYMGAIDDRPSSRRSTLVGARNYLLEAWQAFSEGKKVVLASTKPYGCTVKYGNIGE